MVEIDPAISFKQVAEILGVSVPMVNKLCSLPQDHPDHLENIRIGWRRTVRLSIAERYREERSTHRREPRGRKPQKERYVHLFND